jgi:hypothetical protein
VRALFAQRLAADGVAQHAEAAFDFLADSTLLRAVTLGMVDAAEFCEPLPRWSIRPGNRSHGQPVLVTTQDHRRAVVGRRAQGASCSANSSAE